MPTGIIVANFFVPASVPCTELCLEDTVANTNGKRKTGGQKSAECYVTPPLSGVPNAKRGEYNQKKIASPPGASGPQVGKVAT